MKKADFLALIHEDLKTEKFTTSLEQSKKIYEIIMNNLSNEVTQGRKVVLDNFGTFRSNVVSYKGFGDNVKQEPTYVIKFSPSVTIKKKINANFKAQTEKRSSH